MYKSFQECYDTIIFYIIFPLKFAFLVLSQRTQLNWDSVLIFLRFCLDQRTNFRKSSPHWTSIIGK